MANITRARTGVLLRKLFEVLQEHPEGIPGREALGILRNRLELTEYEKGQYDSGGSRFETIVRYATIDAGKAGWMLKSKGQWLITDDGKAAFIRLQNPEAFYREALRLYHKWKDSQPAADEDTEGEDEEEQGRDATVTIEAAEEQSWAEISQYLRAMPPYEFQELVASLLKAMGYHIAWNAPPGKDGGVDIIAYNDPLGTRPPRIKVQVKRRAESVSVEGLRSFMAILGDEDVGIFVSTGGFTRDARDEARSQQTRQVTLLDLERLYDLWIEHYPRLGDEAQRRFPLRPIYFLSLSED